MRWTLRSKLLSSVGTIIILVLGTSTLIYTQELRKMYRESVTLRSEALAESIIDNILSRTKLLQQDNITAGSNEVQTILQTSALQCIKVYELNKEKNIAFIAVIDTNGTIAAHNDKKLWNTPLSDQTLLDKFQVNTPSTFLKDGVFHTLIPMMTPQNVRLGTIDIGTSEGAFNKKVAQMLVQSGILFGVSLVLSFAAVSLLAHLVVTRPIRRLIAVGEKIARGELADSALSTSQANEFHRHSSDEIETLKAVFHNMAAYLQQMAQAAMRIANGDLQQEILPQSERDALGMSFQQMSTYLRNILQEIESLMQAISRGELSYRTNPEPFSGCWQYVIQELNQLLDAFASPIEMAAETIERIAKGDIPEPLTQAYNGDFNAIKEHLNQLIQANHELTHLAGEIAGGNLQIEVRERSEQDKLMRALNAMTQQLKTVAFNVKTVASALVLSSKELNASAEVMSHGASLQAAASEQASSSMEQMATNIRQNAENSKQTEHIALQSADYAEQGNKVVAETVSAMKQISEKIAIIEEIAGQTRLLSLNATIEAVRAQEHGKPFSVVAAEVRNLSDVTRCAAEEINKLATSSVVVSEKADQMLSTLVPSIHKTAELVQEISAATSEQSMGAEQINLSIQQLDQVTQQNMMQVDKLISTAVALQNQAESLQTTIAFFHIAQMPLEPPKKKCHLSLNLPPKRVKHIQDDTILSFESGAGKDRYDDEFERY